MTNQVTQRDQNEDLPNAVKSAPSFKMGVN